MLGVGSNIPSLLHATETFFIFASAKFASDDRWIHYSFTMIMLFSEQSDSGDSGILERIIMRLSPLPVLVGIHATENEISSSIVCQFCLVLPVLLIYCVAAAQLTISFIHISYLVAITS